MAESVGGILQRGFGHQSQNLGHAVREVTRPQRFFNEFRQSLFRADARPQTLR